MLWAVAGCLFEISLPVTAAGQWRWANPGCEVTLLAEVVHEGRQHLRFRAEGAGAEAGVVQLRFARGEAGNSERIVSIRVAPEQLELWQ